MGKYGWAMRSGQHWVGALPKGALAGGGLLVPWASPAASLSACHHQGMLSQQLKPPLQVPPCSAQGHRGPESWENNNTLRQNTDTQRGIRREPG